VQLARRPQRNRRPGAPKNTSRSNGATQGGDQYDKYLPAWMKGANGAAPPRPARPRRPRAQRPAGGYTPGKLAMNNGDLLS
jgi:hypothetical protein